MGGEGNPAFRTHGWDVEKHTAIALTSSCGGSTAEESRASQHSLMHLWIRSPDKPLLISFGRVLSLEWHGTRSRFHYPWLHLPFGVTRDLLPGEERMTDASRERVRICVSECTFVYVLHLSVMAVHVSVYHRGAGCVWLWMPLVFQRSCLKRKNK